MCAYLLNKSRIQIYQAYLPSTSNLLGLACLWGPDHFFYPSCHEVDQIYMSSNWHTGTNTGPLLPAHARCLSLPPRLPSCLGGKRTCGTHLTPRTHSLQVWGREYAMQHTFYQWDTEARGKFFSFLPSGAGDRTSYMLLTHSFRTSSRQLDLLPRGGQLGDVPLNWPNLLSLLNLPFPHFRFPKES